MAITTTDVSNLAPELASSPRLAWAVEQANKKLNQAVMGDATDLARCYYAAHLLTIVPGTAGMVTSESAGGISRSYKTVENPLELTYYGQEYRRLLRAHAGRAGVVA